MFNADEINKRLKQSLLKSNVSDSIKNPVLKCIVTGKQRLTNNDYLQSKMKVFGDVTTYIDNYICSEALKVFKNSETYNDAVTKLGINVDSLDVKKILCALKYYNVIY